MAKKKVEKPTVGEIPLAVSLIRDSIGGDMALAAFVIDANLGMEN